MNECHISRSHILSSPAAYHFFLSGTSLSTSVPETPHHNTPQTKTAFSLSQFLSQNPHNQTRIKETKPRTLFWGFFSFFFFSFTAQCHFKTLFFFKNPLIFSHQESVMHPQRLSVVVSSFIFYFLFPPFCLGIRSFPTTVTTDNNLFHFTEAPDYRNGARCPKPSNKILSCDPSLVHIAMTLDSGYLRGSIAAVHSVLRHSSCPENIFFHFISAEFDPSSPRVLTHLVRSVFPSLNFKVYIFREDTVINLISSSIRQALENPLNYARNYLGDMLDACVERVIYLDSDIVVVDDVNKLWSVKLSESRVIGAPEYCHANFTKYFTDEFWVDPVLSRVFAKRKPCYFNTGVMVMDLVRWREGNYRKRIENWMELQKKKRIYELGSLPPFLLVFAGNVEGIDHRWNQHGLGGDNLNGVCRSLHPGPVSLLHWSGKGKPWVRLDEKKPCPLDRLWEPYDLYKRGDGRENQIQSWSFSSSVLIGYAHDLL